MNLSHRFRDAFELAFDLHKTQRRKSTQIPYLAHLMAVSAIILENGGDEDQSIAGLLHDAVEDQGGLATLEIIRNQFGERVALLVEACSDSYTLPKPPWRKRKEQFLERLNTVSPEVYLILLADKLHNARTILAELQTSGPMIWDKFNGGKDGSLWYYREMADFFLNHKAGQLAEEFDQLVTNLEIYS